MVWAGAITGAQEPITAASRTLIRRALSRHSDEANADDGGGSGGGEGASGSGDGPSLRRALVSYIIDHTHVETLLEQMDAADHADLGCHAVHGQAEALHVPDQARYLEDNI